MNSNTANTWTDQLLLYFRAGLPVVAIDSPAAEEYAAIETIVSIVGEGIKSRCYVFDLGHGLRDVKYTPQAGIQLTESDIQFQRDPMLEVLDWIDKCEDRALLILVDIHPFLSGQRQDLQVVRRLKNLCFSLQQSSKRVVLLGQRLKLPDEFEGLIEELKNDLPTLEQIKDLLKFTHDDLLKGRPKLKINLSEEGLRKLTRACQGLSEQEILKSQRLLTVRDSLIDDNAGEFVSQRKLVKLAKLGVEFLTAPPVPIGGLGNLKKWFEQRTKLFNLQLQGGSSKLPPPKGILLVGLPGTGKSLIAKTIGSIWGVPVLKFDMGSMFSSLVGESESNLRQLLKVAESVAPCILLVDEMDKAFAAASGPSTDSGVGQRLFGTFLTWMQEKKAPVFVVATANDIKSLPPELSRKGRFDEVFWIDLPVQAEREEILAIYFEQYEIKLNPADVAVITSDWAGAELEQLVKDVLTQAEFEERSITLTDFQQEVSIQIPLARREATKVEELRQWARSARPGSSPPNEPSKPTVAKKAPTNRKSAKMLDLDAN